ncbi:hypothetical protein F5Y10DRAFT_81812 [Nemania abortiva]|nr:hypothetical protein F5Y10DRAFT_81812 [Nemania abortiva]
MNNDNKRKRPAGSDARGTVQKRSRELIVEVDTGESSTKKFSKADYIKNEREHLRRYAERKSGGFFVEPSPRLGRRGAECQLMSCEKTIQGGDYRIAVYPGMNNNNNADLYHIRCFEKLVDFSNPDCLERLEPVTTVTSVRGRNYLVDAGAEKLIFHWKNSMVCLIAERDGHDSRPPDNPDFVELFYNAGSASYTPKKPKGISERDYRRLLELAPIQGDGAGDTDEWDLVEEYSPLGFDDLDDLKQTNSLSSMLGKWKLHVFLATSEDSKLSERGKELRNELSEKAIKVIRRLSKAYR